MISLPVLGGIPPGPTVLPSFASDPAAAPPEPPIGCPGWWSATLPQARLLYPDDQLNILLEEMRRAVPILDWAITALTGLVGKLEFTGSKAAVADFNDWAQRVRINQRVALEQRITRIEGKLD